jgi:pimeloyl-ACP methyl ester carboxylesterase
VLGRPPHYMPAIGDPGTFAAMTTPDSKPGFEALLPAETRWENRVAARIVLRIATYRPGRAAAQIGCPVLASVCDKDTLAPAERTVKLVSLAPRAEIKRYPVGHFDIYVGDAWERAVADQTDFLRRHLVTQAPAPTAAPQTA